ncbi:branched-chain amino acid ABC transporter permease [Streptomyces sp. NPDC006476]|uniref:branched-chain amino acid ABC transporter permease n=1 Tax=Streptomyces sp. NPDC006476 TaxID=3157175 RepID=UPI0033A0A890
MSPDAANPAYLLTLLTGGLVNGSLYGLVGLAVVVLYRATGQVNLAQGEMAVTGALTFHTVRHAGLALWAALPIALAASFALGCAVERAVIRPLERRGIFPVLLATLALFLGLNAANAIIWGTQPFPGVGLFPTGLGDRIELLSGPPPYRLAYSAIGTLAVVAAVGGTVWVALHRTRLGLGYRAVAAHREAAALMGIPVRRMFTLGWGTAAAVGTLAAVLVSQTTGTLDYNLMGSVLVMGLAAATLGGFDSAAGAVLGGLLLGTLEALVPGVFTAMQGDLSLLLALAVILPVLLVRPQGLFGTRKVERV